MAVRQNIGGIRNLVSGVRAALTGYNTAPSSSYNINDISYASSGGDPASSNTDFLVGIHRLGSSKKRVVR